MLGFDHTQGKLTDMWTLSENLRSGVEKATYVQICICLQTKLLQNSE